MKTENSYSLDAEFEPLVTLLKAMRKDPVINKKVVNILKMDSYPRRIVLSNWLEQLRRNNAPIKLTQILSYLFDDIVAEKVLSLINNRPSKKLTLKSFSNKAKT
ncbi:hypothetical protein ACFLSX_02655 [Calditrichota bacterium]